MADHIGGDEPVGRFPQIPVKSIHLTGRAGKKNRALPIQKIAHLTVAFADFTLHQLGPHQPRQLLKTLHGDVGDVQVSVRRCAKNHAAGLQNEAGQRRKNTPGGGA